MSITTFEDYVAIPRMNWSTLKLMQTSPRLLKYRSENPQKDTDAYRLGRAIHCAVLEPDRFVTDYVVKPDGMSFATKEGKAWKAEHIVAAGKEIADAKVHTCVQSIREHAAAAELLGGLRAEQVILWTDAESGVKCKGRGDAMRGDVLVDIKTTGKGVSNFRTQASSLLYHGQLAWYLDGAIAARALSPDADAYVIAVSTSESDAYDVRVDRLPEEAIEAGRRLYRRLLDQWVECDAANIWPGQFPGIGELLPTHWAAGMEQDEIGEWIQ